MYYNLNKTLSYNAILNFIVGERGVGKTYSCKKYVIKDFLKSGKQFVYIRRYKTELKQALKGFFDGLLANKEFSEHTFKIEVGRDCAELLCDGQVMGYALTLSTAVILKSREFPDVKNIIFDEFIITESAYHYLRNEAHQFLEMCETLIRLKDDVRIFMLGNAGNRLNPYFLYFNIDQPYQSEFKIYKDGLILINYIKNLEYRERKRQSKFGKLIDGTEYGAYAIDNQWLHENKCFVEKRPAQGTKFFIIIKLNGVQYGVWTCSLNSKIYISTKLDPSCPITFVINPDDHNTKTKFIKARNSAFFNSVIDHYRQGLLCFETQKIKEMVLPTINKYCS